MIEMCKMKPKKMIVCCPDMDRCFIIKAKLEEQASEIINLMTKDDRFNYRTVRNLIDLLEEQKVRI